MLSAVHLDVHERATFAHPFRNVVVVYLNAILGYDARDWRPNSVVEPQRFFDDGLLCGNEHQNTVKIGCAHQEWQMLQIFVPRPLLQVRPRLTQFFLQLLVDLRDAQNMHKADCKCIAHGVHPRCYQEEAFVSERFERGDFCAFVVEYRSVDCSILDFQKRLRVVDCLVNLMLDQLWWLSAPIYPTKAAPYLAHIAMGLHLREQKREKSARTALDDVVDEREMLEHVDHRQRLRHCHLDRSLEVCRMQRGK